MRRSEIFSLPGLVTILACAGCDPIVNIAGANFPAWLLCAILGAFVSAAFRPAFSALGLEPYLWPLPVVHTALAVLAACVIYLAMFR
jgi:hypothetical protein